MKKSRKGKKQEEGVNKKKKLAVTIWMRVKTSQ